jgi:hypothetical protein
LFLDRRPEQQALIIDFSFALSADPTHRTLAGRTAIE